MEDHDRFLAKNKALAAGYQLSGIQDKLDEKFGEKLDKGRQASCFNCTKKNRCVDFKSKASGGGAGSVSIGADTTFICTKYVPFVPSKNEKPMTGKQIKNIMKLAQRGRL